MTRPARFRESDLTRAVKAVEKVGLKIAGVEVDPDGTIRVLTGSTVANDRRNPLDRLHAA
jgi:hypothetical protein